VLCDVPLSQEAAVNSKGQGCCVVKMNMCDCGHTGYMLDNDQKCGSKMNIRKTPIKNVDGAKHP
jgi:hypothetical protein